MKKNSQLPYRDQLLELGKLYKVQDLKLYAKTKKDLTVSQIELILLKNKIRLPEQSYNKKRIADIRFKEQVFANILITICLIVFVASLLSIRPFIKTVTSEIKFTHVAKEYKSNFKKVEDKKEFAKNSLSKNKSADEHISLDTQVALDIFENLKSQYSRLNSSLWPSGFVVSTNLSICFSNI